MLVVVVAVVILAGLAVAGVLTGSRSSIEDTSASIPDATDSDDRPP